MRYRLHGRLSFRFNHVILEYFHAALGSGIGDFLRGASELHHRLSDFFHKVVVHRRDEALRG